MADAIASTLLGVIFQKLTDEVLKKFARAQKIHSELDELQTTLRRIQALLNDASRKEISDESVGLWLNSLRHLAYDIDDVLDDVATKAMHHELTHGSGAITGKVRKLIVPTCCMMIEQCPSIETFPYVQLSTLNLLEFLVIRNCPNMDPSFPCGLWPPNLAYLGIGGLKKPMLDWGHQNFPSSLVNLMLVGDEEDVSSFNQLSHLLPSSLSQLRIFSFDKLESVSMGLQHLTSLQHLEIRDCPKITHLPEETVLSSLLSLRIAGCPKLEKRCNGRGSHYWPRISHIPKIQFNYRNVDSESDVD